MTDRVLVPPERIQNRIQIVRGRRVILDADLARFYGVGTRDLNKAVSRNLERFPDDFAYMLTLAETRALMFQAGTSRPGHGGVRKPARAFTEQGVAMLASVLRSDRAAVVRACRSNSARFRHAPASTRIRVYGPVAGRGSISANIPVSELFPAAIWDRWLPLGSHS